MPHIYKRNCDICGKYYEGTGKKLCGKGCKGEFSRRMFKGVPKSKIHKKHASIAGTIYK